MPKRRSNEDIEAYVSRKMQKIEKKLRKLKKRRSRSRRGSSSQDSSEILDEPLRKDAPAEDLVASAESPGSPVEDLLISSKSSGQTRQNNTTTKTVTDTVGTVTHHDEEIISNDILQILGEAPNNEKIFNPGINSNVAVRWEHIATNGLSKEAKRDILTKHLIPENCKNIGAPILNQEVKAALTDILNKKDKAIENKQSQIALIISCLGDALSSVISTYSSDINLIKSLTDAGKLACDLQHTESMIRRSFVCSSIKKEIKDHLYGTKIDSHLFGSQLGDLLKAAKAINKTGSEMKTGASASGLAKRSNQTQNLNVRRPFPSAGRQAGAAVRRPTMPASTNRLEYQHYKRQLQRRAPPPPPPPPPRAPYLRSQTHAPPRR